MRITATNIIPGKVDLSSLERLYEKNPIERLPFRASIGPNQSIVVDDKYYTLINIQNSLGRGWITITEFDQQSTFSNEVITDESLTPNFNLTKVEIINRADYPQDAFEKFNANMDIIDSNLGGGGSGTVTSVAISGTDGIEVDSGSPVTGAGTITLGVNKVAMLSTLNVEDGAQVNDPNTLLSGDIGVTVQAYDSTILTDSDIGVTVQGYDANILVSGDIGVTVQAYDSTILTDSDIGVTVQAYDSTILTDSDIGVTVQGYDSTILTDSDIGVTVQGYDANILVSGDIGVTVQGYDANILVSGDIGVTVQAYDSTILTDSDIGVTVQGYDATILTDSDIGVTVQGYDANILVSGDIGVTVQGYDSTILTDSDIGVTIQGYDANILVSGDIGVTVQGYDATILTDSDIGVTVQGYDANILVSGDIGVTVQAYDANILVSGDIGVTVQAYDSTILTDSDIGVTVQTEISGATLTAVTVSGTDKVLIQDTDDSDNLKTITVQSIVDLAGGGPVEGTAVLSTGEVGGNKFLREDGDGTSSWQSTDPYSIQRLVNTASPTAILITDGSILFDTTSTAITIDLPLASVGKITIPFKDIGANASVNNITINSVGGDTIVDIAVAQTSLEIAIDGFSAAMTSNGVDTWYVTYLSSVGGITSAQVDQLESLGYTVQRLVDTASPTAILTTDGAILFDTSLTAISIDLPLASVGKITIPFKDIGGNASVNNITVNRVGTDTIVDVAIGQISTVIIGDGFSGSFSSNGVDTWYLTYGDFGGGGLDSAAVQALIETASKNNIAIIADQKTLGTDGGTFTLGAWRTRDLNTEIYDVAGIVTISANQFTLQAGTYRICARCPAYMVNKHICKLYDITNTADIAFGQSSYASQGGTALSYSVLDAVFVVASETVYEIQHQCVITRSLNGFGTANGFSVETFTVVILEKLA